MGQEMGSYRAKVVTEKCGYCDVCPPVQACPSRAFHRIDKDYPAVVEKEWCLGCGVCVKVCPHHAVTLERRV